MRVGFVDTNILIYAATGANDEPEKWARAHDLLAEGEYCSSAQVLAEFYTIATVKHRLPLAQANEWMRYLERFEIQPVDRGIVLAGVAFSQRFRISYWDAALIAAAQRLGIDTIYTEDLNHGQTYEGVRVVNPLV